MRHPLSRWLRSGPVAIAFACLGCGGRSELPETNAKPKIRTVLLYQRDGGIDLLDFTRLKRPETYPIDVDTISAFPMNRTGQHLLLAKRAGQDGEQKLVFSAPNWSPVVVAELTSEGELAETTTWMTRDGVLVANKSEFRLLDFQGAELLRGSSRGEMIWQDGQREHAIVPGPLGFTWIRPGPDPLFIPDQGQSWSFAFAEPDSELVATVWTDQALDEVPDPGVWTLQGSAPEPDCPFDSRQSCGWTPSYAFHHRASNRAVIGAEKFDEDGRAHLSVSILPWGAQAHTDESPDELAFFRTEMESPGTVEWAVRGDWLWVWVLNYRQVEGIWQLNIRTANAESALRQIADSGDGLWSHRIIGDFDLVQKKSGSSDAPADWRYFSLLEENPRMKHLDRKERYMAPLGPRGAIFLETSALSKSLGSQDACQPCTYFAVQDFADESSPQLSESVLFTPEFSPLSLLLGGQAPVYPTPDGSGVLVVRGGNLDFRTFAEGDRNFRLTTQAAGAYLLLPEVWQVAEP